MMNTDRMIRPTLCKKLLFTVILTLLCLGMSAQNLRKVTGKVTYAEDGQPIIGAAVMVDG